MISYTFSLPFEVLYSWRKLIASCAILSHKSAKTTLVSSPLRSPPSEVSILWCILHGGNPQVHQ